MIVAWHEVPGKREKTQPSQRDGRTGGFGSRLKRSPQKSAVSVAKAIQIDHKCIISLGERLFENCQFKLAAGLRRLPRKSLSCQRGLALSKIRPNSSGPDAFERNI